jgi:phosphoglycolate phosphatase-like HAD superfamily hydrolase
MELFIFDIDGTLIDSTEVDNACYIQAFEEITGVRIEDTDWSRFSHVTDPGLFRELYQLHQSREASIAEHQKFKARFIALIEQVADNGVAFRAVPGAVPFVEEYCKRAGIAVAFATGGYGETARIKLRAAGFSADIPMAHADPHVSRGTIVYEAVALATRQYSEHPEQVTCFGDGVWDMEVARQMGYRFVGVDVDSSGKLQARGCHWVIRDFLDAQSIQRG